LSRHLPCRICLIPEVGKELIEFGLDSTLHAGEQESQDGLKAEYAFAGKKLRLEAGAFQKIF